MTGTEMNDSAYESALAIVGMAGRFPGAHNVEQFWQNIAGGVKSIRRFSDDELLAAGVDPSLLSSASYVKAGGSLEGIEQFDAGFFGYTPREAEIMDPQHRLLLECAWETLEHAGYDPQRYAGLIGVFAGSAFSSYYLHHLYVNHQLHDSLSQLQIDISNDRDSLASKICYKLNLKGPGVSVHTFCSTSLVAVHLAGQSLLNYECDLALAGGVACQFPLHQGYLYEEGGILSPDGECRSFDAKAQGSVMGSGVGMVALKRLHDAVQDGDQIYAVIRGSAMNNDGGTRVSYTAPGLDGQANVIQAALSYAGVSTESISYIETHGTATRLGDAVELAAMRKVYEQRSSRRQFCAIGSVKPNVGHLDRVSGIAGLIKTVQALRHQQLPPSLNFEQPHPESGLEESAFYVNTELRPWLPLNKDEPRRAGVSSFGLGGTNAHVILEEYPVAEATAASKDVWQLLVWSARSEAALDAQTVRLYAHMQQQPDQRLEDIAYTLQVGRSEFAYRRALLCRNRSEALSALHDGKFVTPFPAEHTTFTLSTDTITAHLRAGADGISAVLGLEPVALAGMETREALLSCLARLWLARIAVDWSMAQTAEQCQRVALPTYPFEHKAYWIASPQERAGKLLLEQTALKEQAAAGKLAEVADWFYVPVWERSALEHVGTTDQAWPEVVVLFGQENELMSQLGARLSALGTRCIYVAHGPQFVCLDEEHYALRPDARSDYEQLFQLIFSSGYRPQALLHCWNVETPLFARSQRSFQYYQEMGFYSLVALAQVLDQYLVSEQMRIYVVASGLTTLSNVERLYPERATLLAACKVIPQEYSHLSCRVIDIPPLSEAYTATMTAQVAENILQEIRVTVAAPLVAYREAQRWLHGYRALRLEEADAAASRLRPAGVYVITGGLGKIGLLLAEHLFQRWNARLVLLTHTPFPEHSAWSQLLADATTDDVVRRRIQRLLALEAAGAQIMLVQADVSDPTQLEAAFRQAEEHFGSIQGILHTAGVTDESSFTTLHQLLPADCERHFEAKVAGVLALEEVLRARTVDFCLLFSSLSAVLGGLSLVAYAAANGFMDAFVEELQRQGDVRWLTVNWDSWQFDALESEASHARKTMGTVLAMEQREALSAFERVLASDGTPHLVNSTGDLAVRVRQWIMLDTLQTSLESTSALASAESVHAEQQHKVLQALDYEELLCSIWYEVLGVEQVRLYDNFFDLGGNSLNGLQVIARIRKALQIQLPVVALFEAPTISTMIDYLRSLQAVQRLEEKQPELLEQRRKRTRSHTQEQEIAIIGMSGRFPGADSIEQFWSNLCTGTESLTVLSDEELLSAGVAPELLTHPQYVKARPMLNDVERFDAAFFGYSPREAELLDPQHRLFLECCWEALERAGYDPTGYEGLIGVFGGTNISTYLHEVLKQPELLHVLQERVNGYQVAISMDKDSLTTGVSYKLNLRGPSLAIQTFCSTSLVAVHLASQSLLAGECDMALAGGASIHVPVHEGYLYQPGGQESPDGHCRAFDAQAEGGVFGDGVGLVALKRLADALEDGDQVYAVIKGSAVNNDGAGKVSYTAPSVKGQSQVVLDALAQAGVSAESIGYIEAHGTGTPLGDPIEVTSLTKAFRESTDQIGYCSLGSVKTNVGHLDRAAGVTGLIKAVLALHTEQIPASLHYQEANPLLQLAESPFYVQQERRSWPRGGRPRRAGVNALGMGGTNAHVVLEEAPLRVAVASEPQTQLLLLSAKSEHALQTMTTHLAQHLSEHPEQDLADVAYTLQVGRSVFPYRRMLVVNDRAEARAQLQAASTQASIWHEEHRERPVAFLFPGVGAQFIETLFDLYRHEGEFRRQVDRCCVLLKPYLKYDLREALFSLTWPQHAESEPELLVSLQDPAYRAQAVQVASERMKMTELVQPTTFVVEYALAQLLMQWGIHPQAMLGYSVGECVSACLAGVFSLEDALMLVARRAQLIQQQPEGAMLAVALSEGELQSWLNKDVSVAVINAPSTCVLAGAPLAIAELEARLLHAGIAAQRVEAMHAFHSDLLTSLQESLTRLVQRVQLHVPQIPYISNVTGDWITDAQATDPGYWAEHMCQTVRFSSGVAHLLENEQMVMLEVGPGQALGSFVRQHPACSRERMASVVATLAVQAEHQAARELVLAALGRLWLLGVKISWHNFSLLEQRQRVLLPTYPFERQRYWLPFSSPSRQRSDTAVVASKQGEGTELPRIPDLKDWFFLSTWKQEYSAQFARIFDPLPQAHWLIFLDEQGVGDALVAHLHEQQQRVIAVRPGSAFVQRSETLYTIRVSEREDYVKLCQYWSDAATSALPLRVVHLWSLHTVGDEASEAQAAALQYGLYSLHALAQALGERELESCSIDIVTHGVLPALGTEAMHPFNATLIGACKVLPLEYAQLSCRLIDIMGPLEKNVVRALRAELGRESSSDLVALRGSRRWTEVIEPFPLAAQAREAVRVRTGGVYLITGGLGGIGLALAHWLARTYQARLVLLGRQVLPDREQWDALLSDQDEQTYEMRQRIWQVRELETSGVEVLVLAADVRDERQMQRALAQVQQRFGTLHGIFHAAGVPGIGLTQLKTQQQIADVLAPKLEGVQVLEKLLRTSEVELVVLFSSTTALTGGGPGQLDYSAANAFLDCYAQNWAQQDENEARRVIAIDWSEWQWNGWKGGLEGYGAEAQAYFASNRQRYGIAFADGMEALQRILGTDVGSIIVSTQDFRRVKEQSKLFTINEILKQTHEQRQMHPSYPRPALLSAYVAPGNELERQIATVWEDLLGVTPVGVLDNFFELGGNSLLGLDVIAHLRKLRSHTLIAPHILYEFPTVHALADYVQEKHAPESGEEQQARGRQRRAGIKRMVETRKSR